MNEHTERESETRELRDLARRWRDRMQCPPKRIPPDLMRYAFVLTDGTGDYREPVFKVVTEGGECIPLTHEMLKALQSVILTLCGETFCYLEHAELRPGPNQPVPKLRLTQAIGFSRPEPDDHCCLVTEVEPHDLAFSRLTFLANRRPDGWPP